MVEASRIWMTVKVTASLLLTGATRLNCKIFFACASLTSLTRSLSLPLSRSLAASRSSFDFPPPPLLFLPRSVPLFPTSIDSLSSPLSIDLLLVCSSSLVHTSFTPHSFLIMPPKKAPKPAPASPLAPAQPTVPDSSPSSNGSPNEEQLKKAEEEQQKKNEEELEAAKVKAAAAAAEAVAKEKEKEKEKAEETDDEDEKENEGGGEEEGQEQEAVAEEEEEEEEEEQGGKEEVEVKALAKRVGKMESAVSELKTQQVKMEATAKTQFEALMAAIQSNRTPAAVEAHNIPAAAKQGAAKGVKAVVDKTDKHFNPLSYENQYNEKAHHAYARRAPPEFKVIHPYISLSFISYSYLVHS